VFAYRCAYTEEEGFYSIVGLPTGKYLVFYAGGEECPPESAAVFTSTTSGSYYNGARTESKASPVPVVTGSETNGIGAELAVGAKIEGVVTRPAAARRPKTSTCALARRAKPRSDCTHTGKTARTPWKGWKANTRRLRRQRHAWPCSTKRDDHASQKARQSGSPR